MDAAAMPITGSLALTVWFPSTPRGDWPTADGSLFAPVPLLGFFELLSAGVEDTAAGG